MKTANIIKPMPPRDPRQTHRPSTPLELLFDLVTVIAIASAAGGLHHDISHGQFNHGVIMYVLAMFAIWWAWMNYSWFASAYDNDDVVFRLLTLATMIGSLTTAAGIDNFFKHNDLTLIVIGFVIMRAAMISLWLRASIHHRELKTTHRIFALGLALAQTYWVALLGIKPASFLLFTVLFIIGALIELFIPIIAQKKHQLSWHHDHIRERHGLLNLIVLGETLLAASLALRHILTEQASTTFIAIALAAIIILFSLWWLYFANDEININRKKLTHVFTWTYGHLMVYTAGAAIGAGFAAMIDAQLLSDTATTNLSCYLIAIAVGIYFIGIWLIRDRCFFSGLRRYFLPLCAIIIILCAFFSSPILIGVLTVLAVITRNTLKPAQ